MRIEGMTLIIEAGDQVKLPGFDNECRLAYLTFGSLDHRRMIATWLSQEIPLCRIFGSDQPVESVSFDPQIIRMRVYFSGRI